jgi:hypothetical protein
MFGRWRTRRDVYGHWCMPTDGEIRFFASRRGYEVDERQDHSPENHRAVRPCGSPLAPTCQLPWCTLRLGIVEPGEDWEETSLSAPGVGVLWALPRITSGTLRVS